MNALNLIIVTFYYFTVNTTLYFQNLCLCSRLQNCNIPKFAKNIIYLTFAPEKVHKSWMKIFLFTVTVATPEL